jgi:hypothetical protein
MVMVPPSYETGTWVAFKVMTGACGSGCGVGSSGLQATKRPKPKMLKKEKNDFSFIVYLIL